MADKPSTLKLKVDLDCTNCYTEIQQILCDMQVEERMTEIFYDVKNKTVTISGPFDPHKLSQKLHCKAGKLIKGITVVPQAPPTLVASIRRGKPTPSCNEGKAIVPINAIRDRSVVPGKPISIGEWKPQPPLPPPVASLRRLKPQSSCNEGKAIVPSNAIRDRSVVPGKPIFIGELKPQPPLPPPVASLRNKRPQPPVEINLNFKFGGGCSSCGGSSR